MLNQIELSNANAEVCVIGRCDFNTSIGLLTYGFAEALARFYPTCLQPTDIQSRAKDHITLPSGRILPVWRGEYVKISIFVDVFWNGVHDVNFLMVPKQGLRLACIVWDSDQFPEEWITILNTHYDAAVTTSPHLNEVLRRSGAKVPIVTVPPPLDLEPLLRRPYKRAGSRLRIGCVASYHPRKGTPLLLESFAEAFRDRDDVELLLHSNLSFPGAIALVEQRIMDLGLENVILSTQGLDIDAKNDLIESIDIFANLSRGEGYSIGAREALAMGKSCVLSDVGGHKELFGTPGIFKVAAERRAPGRYPEIDNRIFGDQRVAEVVDTVTALKQAVRFHESGEAEATQADRRARAADFSFSRLAVACADLITPMRAFRKAAPRTPETMMTAEYRRVADRRIVGVGGLTSQSRRVVQMHDGGFYSIFNSFFSHLVWDLRDERCHRTLPDWDVARFVNNQRGIPPTSFCYGQRSDGNIWTKLFKPLFGLSADDMNDETVLYDRAAVHDFRHNESREPLLTYIHAYELYQRPWFNDLRRQYHRVYRDHIALEDSLERDVTQFYDRHMHGRIMLGAHVRHPSHTVEQPSAVIAHADLYIARLKAQAAERGLRLGEWGVFLASDQERVVERFKSEFGDQLVVWENARRTTNAEDSRFDKLSDIDKNKDGSQLQHIVAQSQQNWSIDMAREVIRDAHLMARCHSLLHVVSNVSTAVSYINPECRLEFCG